MPRTKFQGFIFGLIMSYAMTIGMEVYNVAVKMGVNLEAGGLSNITGAVFVGAAKEAAFMSVLVLLALSSEPAREYAVARGKWA